MNENNQPGVTPLFSIMIPVYKPQYLQECIDSILK